MNITTGNISSLVKWFEKDYNPVKFLCLLVSGHLNDSQFFKDVFDNQEALDTISGEDIAIFLFSNEQNGTLTVEVKGGEGEVLSGQILLPNKYRGGLWYEHISNLQKDKIRDDVIKKSQNMASEICDYFRLDYKEIPCILLLGKGEPTPFVIPTQGEVDVKAFYDLLKELREVAKTLPTTYDLDWTLRAIKPLAQKENVTVEKTTLTEAENELQESIEHLHATLEKCEMPHNVCEELFNLQTAGQVWETIGLRQDIPQPPLAVEYSEIFSKAIKESDLKERAREVIRSVRNLDNAKKRLAAYEKHLLEGEKRIAELKTIKGRIDTTLTNLLTIRATIDKLCEKFEQKFVWKARYRPIKQFAETLLGLSKKTSELLSIQETIKKLIVP